MCPWDRGENASSDLSFGFVGSVLVILMSKMQYVTLWFADDWKQNLFISEVDGCWWLKVGHYDNVVESRRAGANGGQTNIDCQECIMFAKIVRDSTTMSCRAHTLIVTCQTLWELEREVLMHRPYSPAWYQVLPVVACDEWVCWWKIRLQKSIKKSIVPVFCQEGFVWEWHYKFSFKML